jgi:hypothetical protein
MNPVITFLLVILLFVIGYLIYSYIYPTSTQLKSLTNLNFAVPSLQITDGQPQSANVSYGIWVYVNSWSNKSQKSLFSRSGDLEVYLDQDTPTLYVDLFVIPNGTGNGNKQTITVTNNFPVQKWVYIIVSTDSRGFADVYMDGKLVKSVKLTGVRGTSDTQGLPDATSYINIGNNNGTGFVPLDAYISKFVRYTYTMDPQTAWNLYLSGNGSTSTFSHYGLQVALTKDGILQKEATLF